MNHSTFKTLALYSIAVGTSIVLLFFVVLCSWIGYEVNSQCKKAQLTHTGTCIEALTEVVKDDNASFSDRNSAIWSLGQLGDARALPVLLKYYTGNIPSREPLNKTISQYELKKAIALAKGGLNLSAFIWRSK